MSPVIGQTFKRALFKKYQTSQEAIIREVNFASDTFPSTSYTNTRDYQSSRAQGLGVQAEVPLGSVEANDARTRAVAESLSIQTLRVQSVLQRPLFEIRLQSPGLDPKLWAQIQELPETYSNNKDAYKLLLITFGTHFLNHITLGGKIEQRGLIQACFVKTSSHQTVEQAAKVKFERSLAKR